MAGPLNAKVILARCSQNRACFGIRIEQRGHEWVRTWSFPLDENKARREGYNAASTVTMSGIDDNYPGCPFCKNIGIVQCACDKIGCGGGGRDYGNYAEYSCPWCGDNCELEFAAGLNVSGGGY